MTRNTTPLFVLVLCFLGLSVCNLYGQGSEVPPPLNPFDSPWPSPGAEAAPPGVPPTGFPPAAPGGAEPAPAPFTDESNGGFDPFDEDDSGGGGGGSSAPSRKEGKQSFVLLNPEENRSCPKWTHQLDTKATFDDQDACLSSLEKSAKTSKENILKSEDTLERAKLKSVIKGDMTRDDSKSYKVSHERLRGSIDRALKKRCACAK